MSQSRFHLYAGTAGHSAWFSDDLGETWVHPNSHSGMYLEARVWAFASHPSTPATPVRRHRHGRVPMGRSAGALGGAALADAGRLGNPAGPAGCEPADRGLSPGGPLRFDGWRQQLGAMSTPAMPAFSEVNSGPTRVTQILFDPIESGTIWSTVEVGGIFRSRDRGAHWELRDQGLVSVDVHGVAVVPTAAGLGSHVYATTNRGLHRSDDGGETWTWQELANPWQYTRAIVPRPGDPSTLFLGTGNGPPGNDGRLLRSRDHGLHWEPVRLPGDLNSTVWCIAIDPADPQLMLVGTNLGQLFRSEDGGDHWTRLPHEFGEIRALHCRPLPDGTRQAAHSITRPMIKVPW